MKEIREIFETVRTYCGMMFGENRAAKSVMGNTESILAPMAGEDAIVHERLVSVTSAGAGESQNEIIQSYPSPEFLNSLPFIKKFYPAPRWGEGKVTEVAHDNNFDSPETVYSLLTTHHSLKRAAFTLAEVLITLGIIGVVAALTLPTLIQNHQKQVYVTQLKKAYSTLGNAFNKMAVDEDVVDWKQTYCGVSNVQREETFDDECYTRILKQFNVVQSRKANEDKAWGNSSYDVSGSSNSVHGGEYMFATADGTTYIFPCYTVFQYNNEIVVDVNGLEKGPNKEGRDVFSFYIDFNNNKILPGGTYDYFGNASESYKSCSATNFSADCTAKVLKEGKMNY